jgi:hypothetical protein
MQIQFFISLEDAMKNDFRQLHQPKTSRIPAWLQRVWLWF